MDVIGIGSIISGLGSIAGELVTTDKERIELAIKGRELDLKEKELDQRGDALQVGVNMEEAKNASLFVSGWRPSVGWICSAALGYAALLEPMARFVATVVFKYAGAFPVIDTTLTLQVLLGLLGLGALRSAEKKWNVTGN